VVEIARKAETSPATFYHYFKDVEEAALRLAQQVADETPAMLELIGGSWDEGEGLETSRRIAAAFMEHWEAHHAVLLIRNLAADKGDPRFQEVRRNALEPLLDALASQIERAQSAGQISARLHPFVTAAALGALLEALSAHAGELSTRRITREDLIDTCAGILYQVVTGHSDF
jgi:AcrR family transcriptional regulator